MHYFHGHGDPEDLKNARLDRGTRRRAATFAKPYRAQLITYAVVIVAGTLVGAIPPLVFKALIDTAIPRHDHRLLMELVAAAAALAVGQTAIGLVNRWISARVGEGLIFDLRTKL